jgi:peptidoglycan hydrolase-like protein with peptidoglycan-binding domain
MLYSLALPRPPELLSSMEAQMRTKNLLLIFLAYTLISTCCSGQIQRLIIPEANVTIAPGSSAKLSTFCTDYGILGPSRNQAYGHLLTSPDSARITIGKTEMSLGDALRSGKIKLLTPRPTIDSLVEEQRHFNELDPSHAIDLTTYRSKLQHLAPGGLDKEQNPSSLQLVNLSGEQVHFVAHNAAVGTADSPPPIIPATTNDQNKIWTAQIQQQLVRYGYKTHTDGELGPDTKAVLSAFQKKHGLTVTGTPTEATAATLRRIDADNWIKSLPKGPYTVARLDIVEGESIQYHLTTSDENVFYHGNLPDGLIDALSNLATVNSETRNTIYLEAPGFSEKDRAKLVRNLTLAGGDAPVVIIPSPEQSSIFREAFFRKGARFDAAEVDGEMEQNGPYKGWFHSVFRFLVDFSGQIHEITLDVWAKTKKELQIVYQTFRGTSTPDRILQLSMADIVAKGRRNLVAGGYSSRALKAQLRDGTKRYLARNEAFAGPSNG